MAGSLYSSHGSIISGLVRQAHCNSGLRSFWLSTVHTSRFVGVIALPSVLKAHVFKSKPLTVRDASYSHTWWGQDRYWLKKCTAWPLVQRVETKTWSISFTVMPSFDNHVHLCMLRRWNQEPAMRRLKSKQKFSRRSELSLWVPLPCESFVVGTRTDLRIGGHQLHAAIWTVFCDTAQSDTLVVDGLQSWMAYR